MFQQKRTGAALAAMSLAGALIGCGGAKPSPNELTAAVEKLTNGEVLAVIPSADGRVVHRELSSLISANPNAKVTSILRTGPDTFTAADGAGFVVTLEPLSRPANYRVEFVAGSQRDDLAPRLKEIREAAPGHKIDHIVRTGPAQFSKSDGAGFLVVLSPKEQSADNK